MIHVLHGEDEFSIAEALARIRESVGPPEVRDPNTTTFDGRGAQPGALVGAASAVPFLAERRLVVVSGLLSRFEDDDKTLGAEWDSLPARLEHLPATTELVFVEDRDLKRGGRGLRAAGPRAVVKEFKPPRFQALDAWIKDRFAAVGAQAEPDAIARLAWLAGGSLRLLDQEARKLALHANGRPVRREDVDLLVPEAREENIFAAVDAILERRPGVAMKLLYSLLAGGASAGQLLNLLARQVRLVILARELADQSVPPEDIGRRIGLKPGFALDKTLRQAPRFSPAHLAATHRRLLDADLSIKTGELDERLAIEILVARLSAA
jgi:DNA polymerase-3 subunit delta